MKQWINRMLWRAVLCEPEERVELECMPKGPEKDRRQSRYNAAFISVESGKDGREG